MCLRIFKRKKSKSKPCRTTEKSLKIYSEIYNIPLDLVKYIYILCNNSSSTINEVSIDYTCKDFELILAIVKFIYHNQSLIGRKLPSDHPKSIEIDKYLNELGVCIQWHPYHGMVIVENRIN